MYLDVSIGAAGSRQTFVSQRVAFLAGLTAPPPSRGLCSIMAWVSRLASLEAREVMVPLQGGVLAEVIAKRVLVDEDVAAGRLSTAMPSFAAEGRFRAGPPSMFILAPFTGGVSPLAELARFRSANSSFRFLSA